MKYSLFGILAAFLLVVSIVAVTLPYKEASPLVANNGPPSLTIANEAADGNCNNGFRLVATVLGNLINRLPAETTYVVRAGSSDSSTTVYIIAERDAAAILITVAMLPSTLSPRPNGFLRTALGTINDTLKHDATVVATLVPAVRFSTIAGNGSGITQGEKFSWITNSLADISKARYTAITALKLEANLRTNFEANGYSALASASSASLRASQQGPDRSCRYGVSQLTMARAASLNSVSADIKVTSHRTYTVPSDSIGILALAISRGTTITA